MILTRLLGRFTSVLLISVLISCNSEPKESEFTKTAREVFFGVDFSGKYEDALSYYKGNSNLVDVKMFDSAAAGSESSHQFIFQKHPLVKEGLKAGTVYVSRDLNDSASFRQVFYFVTKQDALRSFQQIDARLRKPSTQVVTSDSVNKKVVMYAADRSDVIHGILADLVSDSADQPAVLTLNLVKNHY
jgi:hypothetical protein